VINKAFIIIVFRRNTVSGLQEILLILIIALAVFYLPRLTMRQPVERTAKPSWILSGRMRLAIVGSFLWMALSAVLLKPWDKNWLLFFYFGIGPVILEWSLIWVIVGYRKYKE
jgi:hypothetical protein